MGAVYTDESKFNVMISYSHQDSELMLHIRDLLTANGFDVWVDTKLKGGSNFFNNIGSAVIGCDIFVFIITESSVASRFCQDEVSLARISNKKIMPITYCEVMDVVSSMDAGLRLILSCVQWIVLDRNESDMENDKTLVTSLHTTLQSEQSDAKRLDSYEILFSDEENTQDQMTRSKTKILRRQNTQYLGAFWSRNIGDDQGETDVKKVFEAIKRDYRYDYGRLGLDDAWALKALSLWCFDLERSAVKITREQYDRFVFPEGKEDQAEDVDTFWVRCKDGFSVRLSMHEVFNSQSSVRYDSIQNLSKIKSKRVLTALYKLLRDSDPNIRAVACISLSCTDVGNLQTVERVTRLLEDSDRLVRESACIALGKFCAPNTTKLLLKVWRNDMISDVRSAAVKALNAIGTPEAQEGMRVVKTLQDEFNKLGMEAEEEPTA